jgi:hypothetical protein
VTPVNVEGNAVLLAGNVTVALVARPTTVAPTTAATGTEEYGNADTKAAVRLSPISIWGIITWPESGAEALEPDPAKVIVTVPKSFATTVSKTALVTLYRPVALAEPKIVTKLPGMGKFPCVCWYTTVETDPVPESEIM